MWDKSRRFANQSLGWCGIFCLNRFTKKARTERDDGRSDKVERSRILPWSLARNILDTSNLVTAAASRCCKYV